MIDYIRFYVRVDKHPHIQDFLESLGLSFYPQYNKNEITYFKHEHILGFTIKIYDNIFLFEGSLHKLYNQLHNKKGNHTHFDFQMLTYTICWICQYFAIEPKNAIIKRFEIGVNLSMEYEVSQYLNIFKSYQFKKPFTTVKKNKHIQCRLTQYYIKVYDKTYESKFRQNVFIKGNIVRIELVFTKMQPIKKIVSTLDDLIIPNHQIQLTEFLLKKYNQIIFHHKLENLNHLSQREREIFYLSQVPAFWETKNYYNRILYKKLLKNIKQSQIVTEPLVTELDQKMTAKITQIQNSILPHANSGNN